MKISLIAAVAANHAIGKDNDLLWHLPVDMKFFKDKTSGHHILTGRKNYESIPEKYRPLPNRENIIITRNSAYTAPGAHVFTTIQEGIDFAAANGEEELQIIGGADIYRQTMEVADILYITWVDASFDADAYFPEIEPGQWELAEEKKYPADEKHPYDLRFCTYIRKKQLS